MGKILPFLRRRNTPPAPIIPTGADSMPSLFGQHPLPSKSSPHQGGAPVSFRGPARDIIAVNAACALYVAGAVASLQEGRVRAAEAIDSGRALGVLEHVKELSHAR